ncbi:integral membrane protein [Fusarium beomiforme]|uniref:Integral membrane protein n=1 Tax=Fusarium beomiforme TaxID=44412 RepID=A0A9P5ANZ2_9HYPO|nr:integral membrane protein [Fusarium beomiforme]
MIGRLYARCFMSRAFGVDDMLALLGFALTVTLSSIEIAQVQNGSGSTMSTLSPAQLKAFFTTVDMPIGVFIRCVKGIGVVIVLITLAAFLFFLLECKPITDLFNRMNPDRHCVSQTVEAHVLWAHAFIGVLIDAALFGMPIWVIYKNMTFGSKAIKVILVFCVGLVAIIIGIVRICFMMTTDFAVDTTYKMGRVAIWVTIELHVGLWCGSFPALQPLLRLVSYQVGLRSHLSSTNKTTARGTETGTRPGASKYIKQPRVADSDPESDGASARAIVSGGDSTAESVELGLVDNGGIKVITHVTVRVEDQGYSRDRNKMETTWDAI